MKRIKKVLKYLLIVIIVLAIIAAAPALFYKQKTNDNPMNHIPCAKIQLHLL